MPILSREETAKTVALIRELLAKGELSQRQIALRTGYKQGSISDINRGRRRNPKRRPYAMPAKALLDLYSILGIVRSRTGLMCPRCEERRYLITSTGLCVECQCLALIRQGVAKVQEVGDATS